MNTAHLLEVIAEGEGLHTEFKEAVDTLPANLFDTVCAFLNTDGGLIFLGVSDRGEIIGVDQNAISRMKVDIANLSNNPQKIDLPYLLFPYATEIDGKTIIVIQVPLSSQLHKHKGEIFLRSEDGDYRVQGTHQLAGLLNRKLGIFSEQRPIRFSSMADLRPELFDRARRLMRSYNSQHPWADLSDEELLHIGGFYTTDPDTGKTVLSLAGILIFGHDVAIAQAVPAYKFDCLLRRDNEERYDDRLMIRTNLIDAYDQMMGFVEKHLNDPFYLEGTQRISLRDKIFREAVSNIVSHREYSSGSPARLMIYQDRVIFDNPGIQHHFSEITLENLRPFSKNPTICKFMIQLGRFDELGSGVRNINKYLPLYAHGTKPIFKDTMHGFELTIPLAEASEDVTGEVTPEVTPEVAPEVTPEVHRMLVLLDGEMSRKEIQQKLELVDEKHFREHYQQPAIALQLIEMTIPDKPRSSKQRYRLTALGEREVERVLGGGV